MNTRKLLPLLLIGLSAYVLSVNLIPAEDTPLELTMQQMKKAYKGLSDGLKVAQDADKDKLGKFASIIVEMGTKARGLVPAKAEGLTDDQKKALIDGYQKQMDAFILTATDLSKAVQNGKWDDARKLNDTLKQEMFAGHKQYRKED